MNEHIVECIYHKNNSYQIIEVNSISEKYFYVKRKTFFGWKKSKSNYIENKFDSLDNARKYLYKFDKDYIPYEPKPCPTLTGKAAENFLNQLKENESKPKIDITESVQIMEKILKNSKLDK